jgi:hypothetical protein
MASRCRPEGSVGIRHQQPIFQSDPDFTHVVSLLACRYLQRLMRPRFPRQTMPQVRALLKLPEALNASPKVRGPIV